MEVEILHLCHHCSEGLRFQEQIGNDGVIWPSFTTYGHLAASSDTCQSINKGLLFRFMVQGGGYPDDAWPLLLVILEIECYDQE